MSTVDFGGAAWRKSRRSGQGSNANCVEVARAGDAVGVRDSKHPAAGHLAFPAAGWARFLKGLGAGD